MDSILVMPAYVNMCNRCHRHCTVVYGDGKESRRIDTIEEGRTELRDALHSDRIVGAEFDELLMAIKYYLPWQRELNAVLKSEQVCDPDLDGIPPLYQEEHDEPRRYLN